MTAAKTDESEILAASDALRRWFAAGLKPTIARAYMPESMPYKRVLRIYRIYGRKSVSAQGQLPVPANILESRLDGVEGALFLSVYRRLAGPRLPEGLPDPDTVIAAHRRYIEIRLAAGLDRIREGKEIDLSACWVLANALRCGTVQLRKCRRGHTYVTADMQARPLCCDFCSIRESGRLNAPFNDADGEYMREIEEAEKKEAIERARRNSALCDGN